MKPAKKLKMVTKPEIKPRPRKVEPRDSLLAHVKLCLQSGSRMASGLSLGIGVALEGGAWATAHALPTMSAFAWQDYVRAGAVACAAGFSAISIFDAGTRAFRNRASAVFFAGVVQTLALFSSWNTALGIAVSALNLLMVVGANAVSIAVRLVVEDRRSRR